MPQGAGGVRRCGWEKGGGGGPRRLTVWILVSLSPGRGGGVYKAGVGKGGILPGSLVPPDPQLRVSLGQQAHPHPHVPMKTLLSWFSVTLSLALRSDVFWNRSSKRRREWRGRWDQDLRERILHLFIQASCCSQLGILLSASVHPRMPPYMINWTRTESYSSPQLPAYKNPPYFPSPVPCLPIPREG